MATRGHPWSLEEDRIILRSPSTAESIAALEEAGYRRTREAVLSRRKVLAGKEGGKDPTNRGEALARERTRLEKELRALEERTRAIRERLIEIRVDTVKDALGTGDIPDDVLTLLRDVASRDGST